MRWRRSGSVGGGRHGGLGGRLGGLVVDPEVVQPVAVGLVADKEEAYLEVAE